MMTPEKLKILEQKFSDYADQYIQSALYPAPLILKKEHTMRVCQEIEELLRALLQSGKIHTLNGQKRPINISLLNSEAILLARAMALFHDLGRFRQFKTYKTFLDHKSVNHAGLSIIEIDKNEMLTICSERERSLIKGAIAVHNAAELPQLEDLEMLFFMQLLRDADKLDIWRVVINNYTSADPQTQETVNLGLQDGGSCSTEALDAILSHTYVRINSIRELNDLKLMQISWIFDLNFPQSLQQVKERRYIEQIVSTLSLPRECQGLTDALESAYNYMQRNGAGH